MHLIVHITQTVCSQPEQAVAVFMLRCVVELNAWRDCNKAYIFTTFALTAVEICNVEALFPKPLSKTVCFYVDLLRCFELHSGIFGIT